MKAEVGEHKVVLKLAIKYSDRVIGTKESFREHLKSALQVASDTATLAMFPNIGGRNAVRDCL